MKAAVLGAGFQGVCVALELARRGVHVDLYDKNTHPITQAGLFNEGKIHLGFVYANDPTMKTADLMIRGALRFRKMLNRWIDFDEELVSFSSPFYYAVHRDSLLPPDQIRTHFEQVRSRIVEMSRRDGDDYLGSSVDFVFEELAPSETARLFDRRSVATAFRTIERSVDTVRLADRLRDAVEGCANIQFLPQSMVTGARFVDAGIAVEIAQAKGAFSARYDHVVNALWGGRMAVDATIGIQPKRRWLHRFKYGIRIHAVDRAGLVPSTTIVLGQFGDIVRFPNDDLYLSWYPVCLGGMSSDLLPPDWPREPKEPRSRVLFVKRFQALSSICPVLGGFDRTDLCTVTVRGGDIIAWGSTDIDEINSELHARFDIGPFSTGRYHSIDTGKYCVAPMFALEVADQICGHR